MSDQDDRHLLITKTTNDLSLHNSWAKRLEQVLHFLNDYEDDLAHVHYLIRVCSNDHEGALVWSLEPFHRLVWLYRKMLSSG